MDHQPSWPHAGHQLPGVVPRTIVVDGVERTFWLAPAEHPDAPLLIGLHGLGTSGKLFAALSGLHRRAPAAGFAAVFPDALYGKWVIDDSSGRDSDRTFLLDIVAMLEAERIARPGPVVLVGLSHGAFFAEHLARHGELSVCGLTLVAGSATAADRREQPLPAQACDVLCFAGTADPMVPYHGGPIGARGPVGWLARRRAGRRRSDQATVAAAIETVARDWARANGIDRPPTVRHLPGRIDELAVVHTSWSSDAGPGVDLYAIDSGGHAWPGGPQYLPAHLIGPVARQLDATAITLARMWPTTQDGSSLRPVRSST